MNMEEECLKNKNIRERFIENAEEFDSLMVEMLEENNRLRELYNELIMNVCSKFPGESRHETALRYIKSAEKPINNCEKTV